MDKFEAAKAIREEGKRVRVTVGTGPDDPVLIAWAFEGMVMSEAVGGWSAGVVERVCALDSDYLTEHFLEGKERIEVVVPPAIAESKRGLRASVLKHAGQSSSNGGLSSRVDDVTIVGPGVAAVGGTVFEPSEVAPPVMLKVNTFSFGTFATFVPAEYDDLRGAWRAVKVPGKAGPMHGGTFVETSDARFAELLGLRCGAQPVPLHDRFE